MQVLDLVAANANDSMVDCTLPGAAGNWGICASMLIMLQDDTKATFVKSTLVNVVRAGNAASSVHGWQQERWISAHHELIAVVYTRALYGSWAEPPTRAQGKCKH